MESMSCDARVKAARLGGPCGRPDIGQGTSDCGNTEQKCNAKYGGDGSRWCADDTDGCCQRYAPPLANQFKCCTTLDPMDSETCGSLWCPHSDDCKGVLGDYCSQVANVTKPVCQLFCSKVENKALCDPTMRTYCAQQAVKASPDPLCSCLLADLDGVPAASCFYAPCTAGGYQTLDHVNQASNCPSMCGVIIDCARLGTCKISGNDFRTYCCASNPELCAPSGNQTLFQKMWDWINSSRTRQVGALLSTVAFVILLLILVSNAIGLSEV
ncbi:hypothetical protein QKT49_gp103 [Acanthamoeba castellanii medusavirus]|uniref:Uncharacterized protein n=1 Tax=Acanthamoeba castellanii medusavirus J1 TaxID=3114988 RepID=A0A3T1CWN8_9VIRU|nr:hypothetical protein QKT49_gp103 [Acanthamoeba castellanii medusavirus]BBI30243.1 hypothetical protein [Acanthamoeba castellanii medusavirus J1]